MGERALKEWAVDLWIVLKDGQPFDYAYSRASAYAKARKQRPAHPSHFWSIAPVKGTISIRVPT